MFESRFEYLLRLGDNALILSQRLSEWCGHAPAIEEDIAVANIALDLIGQAKLWLELAGNIENQQRSADDLAFLRDVLDFRNLLLVERPNFDYGHTMVRQFLFDSYHKLLLNSLSFSKNENISAIATKAHKEVSYHLERSSETVISLGDGTEESNKRVQEALDNLWPYVGEMFLDDKIDITNFELGYGPLPSSLESTYLFEISEILKKAFLETPKNKFVHTGGKSGHMHTEDLGYILAQMQYLQRSYPEASW